ncbi:spore cortex biosynthesis protein YabQ [Halalkalibacillus halophilus]|uniref:spore cortex biosynthesis protein YabQ n=1 Tax=Halalkalibacillus halophilus TaxID=392827 RepID=UPI00041672CC|nr:spore cortex biosynthesis protein YabQ [Halalkalibacillus halophilus]
MTLATQWLSLLAMISGGIGTALVFNTYSHLFRSKNTTHQMITDPMVVIVLSFFSYYLLYMVNGGIIRFYLVVAFLLGITIYYAMFEKVYLRVLDRVVVFVKKIWYGILKLSNIMIIKPLIWISIGLLVLIRFFILTIWKVFRFVILVLFKIIRPFIPSIVRRHVQSVYMKCRTSVNLWKRKLIMLWRRIKNAKK